MKLVSCVDEHLSFFDPSSSVLGRVAQRFVASPLEVLGKAASRGRRIERFPPDVRFRVDVLRRDGCQAGTLETARIQPIAQHGDDGIARRRSVAGIDERL